MDSFQIGRIVYFQNPRRPLIFTIFVFIVLLFSLQPAHAVKVDKLYEAFAPVSSRAAQQRPAALREILRRIVVKVSGQNVLPSGFASSTQIEALPEQFGYESRKVPGHAGLHLWARLNAAGMNRLIRDAGLPIWPVERPATLLWLAIQDKTEEVLGEDSEHEVMAGINVLAGQRGIPVIYPIMDLTESSKVDYGKVALLDAALLSAVSEKYASQYQLIGHIQRVSKKRWRARWRIVGGSVAENSANSQPVIVTPTGPLSDVLAAAINPLASRIARQFSSFSRQGSAQYIDITLDDVNGAEDYVRSLKYLESLSPVSKVDVLSVDGKKINFRLHTRVDMASLLQVISLGRVLYARDAIDQLVFGLSP